MEFIKSSLRSQRNARLVWLKVVQHKQVKKERFFKSSQSTPYELMRIEKNQDLDRREQNMAVQCARFISVREGLVGKNIFNNQRLKN